MSRTYVSGVAEAGVRKHSIKLAGVSAILMSCGISSLAQATTYTLTTSYTIADGQGTLAYFQIASNNLGYTYISAYDQGYNPYVYLNSPGGSHVALASNSTFGTTSAATGYFLTNGTVVLAAGTAPSTGYPGSALYFTSQNAVPSALGYTTISSITVSPEGGSALALSPSGTQAVTTGQGTNSAEHPLLYTSLSGAPVTMSTNIASYSDFYPSATDGTYQAGTALNGSTYHAVFWSSNGASVKALNVPVASSALAVNDVAGGTVVGTMTLSSGGHYEAVGWTNATGTAGALGLTASGFADTVGIATNGSIFAGYGDTSQGSGINTPLVWSSTGAFTALSVPTGYNTAEATSIDSSGDIYGWAENTSTLNAVALEWMVPEPASSAIVLLAAGGLLLRRRRARVPA